MERESVHRSAGVRLTHPNNGVMDPGWRYLGVISKRLRWASWQAGLVA
jgi:hypothetical protein